MNINKTIISIKNYIKFISYKDSLKYNKYFIDKKIYYF